MNKSRLSVFAFLFFSLVSLCQSSLRIEAGVETAENVQRCDNRKRDHRKQAHILSHKRKRRAFYGMFVIGTLLIIALIKYRALPVPRNSEKATDPDKGIKMTKTPSSEHNKVVTEAAEPCELSDFVHDITKPFGERANRLIIIRENSDGGGSIDNVASLTLLNRTILYAQTYETQKKLYDKACATFTRSPSKNDQELFDDLLYEQLLGIPRQPLKELAAFSPLDIFIIARTLLEGSYQIKEVLTDEDLFDTTENAIKSHLAQMRPQPVIDIQQCRAPMIKIMQDLKTIAGFRSQGEYARHTLLIEVIASLKNGYSMGDGVMRIPYNYRKRIFELSLTDDERTSMLSLLSSITDISTEMNQYLKLLITANPQDNAYIIERIAFCLERLFRENSIEALQKALTIKGNKRFFLNTIQVDNHTHAASLGDYDTYQPSCSKTIGLDQLQKAFEKACSYLCIFPQEATYETGPNKHTTWVNRFTALLRTDET